MTIKELLENGAKGLAEAGIEDAAIDARVLAEYTFKKSYSRLMLELQTEASEQERTAYEAAIGKRASRVPCQYITHEQNFMGYGFYVDEGVLVPRPETELLVEEAVKLAGTRQNLRVLDLCTGTGCIGISYYLERKKRGYYDTVLLADVSLAALSVAARNRDTLAPEVQIVKSDLFENIEETFDLILSNPPYIKRAEIKTLMPEVRDHEPRLALDGTEDGLYFYRRITEEAEAHLNEGAILMYEIGCDQMDACTRYLVAAGYTDVQGKKDYSGLDRIVYGKMEEI